MKDVLNSFELRMLRRADYLRERNIFGESHVYSYGTLPVFHIGREIGWADSLHSLAFIAGYMIYIYIYILDINNFIYKPDTL